MELTDKEIIQALWEGRKIRRAMWDTGVFLWVSVITGQLHFFDHVDHVIKLEDIEEQNNIDSGDLEADDWEVIYHEVN